ncbi:MAG: hypothetical protein JNM20_13465 [Rhizobiales bacterium]|nr:hypothetical protein [Hyphomicrobiales bacterium]
MFRSAWALLILAILIAAGNANAQAAKDQSRVSSDATPTPDAAGPATQAPAAGTPEQPAGTAEPEGEDLTQPDAGSDAVTGEPVLPEDLSLGEIPIIKTIELTVDAAKRALDVFALVKEKYKDANLEEYEDLQEFVDKAPQGKEFEADVKAQWFSTVTEWNSVITSVGFAYSAIVDDQSSEIALQIEEIKKDATIAQEMKDKMIESLSAMIPSDNNRRVVEDLLKEPDYADKLSSLIEDE